MESPRPTNSREQQGYSASEPPVASVAEDGAASASAPLDRERLAAAPAAQASAEPPSWVLVARLIRPHGRRGELVAEILTDFPERFHERSRLFLIPTERVGSRPREVLLENFWFLRSRMVMKFQGVDSINDAEALRGFEVAIPAGERAPLEAGSVYVSDLIGCRVVDLNRDGADVGEVVDVDRDSSSTELLVVRRRDRREGDQDALIPFVRDYTVRVDAAHRLLEMRLPEGLLEINAPISEEEKREAAERG
jgi:16S rRNA processing protein RimM